jgi:hypothetical protein
VVWDGSYLLLLPGYIRWSGQERRRFLIGCTCMRACMFYEGKVVWAKPSSFSYPVLATRTRSGSRPAADARAPDH